MFNLDNDPELKATAVAAGLHSISTILKDRFIFHCWDGETVPHTGNTAELLAKAKALVAVLEDCHRQVTET